MMPRSFVLLLGWAFVLVLLIPVLHTAWVSFSPDSFLTPPTNFWSTRWYEAFAQDRRWMAALLRSFVVAVASAVIAVTVATPAAYALQHYRTRWHGGIVGLLLLPACMPVAALGMGILCLFYWTKLSGTLSGLVLVHAVLGLPIAFLIIRSQITPSLLEYEQAARGLGATRWQIVRRVVLPLLQPALVAAGVAVFVLSWNESLVTLFLSTPTTETLPALIWPQLRYSPTPMVAVASCVTVIIGVGGLVVVFRLLRLNHQR